MIVENGKSRIATIAACSGLALLMGGGWASAQDDVTVKRDISVRVDGRMVPFADIGPQQIEGRTLVPVRGVLERLGADVGYDSATQVVTATTPTIDIRLRIGSRRATVNGRPVTLDVPAQTIEDRTFVPLRFLGESLGARVTWNEATRTVTIRTGANNGEESVARDDRDTAAERDRDRADQLNRGRERRDQVNQEGNDTDRPRYRLRDRDADNAGDTGDRTHGRPPGVFDVSPANDSIIPNARPQIVARFAAENGSSIDPDTVRITLDTNDVTDLASITGGSITFTPRRPLTPGLHSVEVRVADRTGNQRTHGWVFTVQPRTTSGIVSITGTVARSTRSGDTIRVEMSGAPGGRAMFSIGDYRNVEMTEERPGRYVGEVRVRAGEDMPSGPVMGRLDMPDGERYRREMSVNLNAGAEAGALRITSPRRTDEPFSPMVIRGHARPGARVTVKVEYRDIQPGLAPIHGNAAEVVVYADRNGDWETRPLDVAVILRRRVVDYTITATSMSGPDNRIETTSMHFMSEQ
ncbi:MAG TPA: stalk domain-containing protein [Chloroflexota bacterium]|nr:stalk domain-containing protein [Chloroflexota bacterium]